MTEEYRFISTNELFPRAIDALLFDQSEHGPGGTEFDAASDVADTIAKVENTLRPVFLLVSFPESSPHAGKVITALTAGSREEKALLNTAWGQAALLVAKRPLHVETEVETSAGKAKVTLDFPLVCRLSLANVTNVAPLPVRRDTLEKLPEAIRAALRASVPDVFEGPR
ncbi:MAG TPA: hypothetical protein VHB73_02990 [Alphaproteobacteria bacterium]|nr:hypothetical protein [Alphaproteobacteria bacterium]